MNDEIKADVVNRVLPPSGMHRIYICVVAVLGTVSRPFEGKPKQTKKVLLGLECVDTAHVWKEGEQPKRLIHFQEYTLSMGSKGKLRPLLEGLKGESMTDAQAKEFNIANLLNCCLNANLIKKVSASGNERREIAGLIQMSDADAEKMPSQENEGLCFTFAQPFKTEIFNKLPAWVQKEITSSEEYKELYPSQGQPQAQASSQVANGAKKKNVPF